MKTKILLAAGVILTALSLLTSCSDDDNEPGLLIHSLAVSYLQPTGFSVSDLRNLTPEERNEKANLITFSGNYINQDSAPEEFTRISRLYGDTAYSKKTAAYWPEISGSFSVVR